MAPPRDPQHDMNEVPDTVTVEEERYMAPPALSFEFHALHDVNDVPDTVAVEE